MRAKVVLEPGFCHLYTPYLALFVEALKAAVPARARRWDPTDKCWTVQDRFAKVAIRVVGDYFNYDTIDNRGEEASQRRQSSQGASSRRSSTGTPWPILIHDAMPERLRPQVFRALTRVLHPDAGGDTRLMQELNDQWPTVPQKKGR